MKKILLSLGMATLLLAACQSQQLMDKQAAEFDTSVTKTISTGPIKGSKDEKNDVLQWLGVPYAQAERWKEPKKVKAWKEELDTTSYGEQAIQANQGKVSGKEDALNLDIVRPNTPEKKLPVMVYIHGGNNQTGSAQEIKGNSFVTDINAVYVSVNYRLGPLGFNPLPAIASGKDEASSGNFTLLDIAAALDWVEENIETFGGDKENVTLAGFSAGGRDVMATLISPVFKGKYDKAISFSGGMTLADLSDSREIFAKALAPLVVEDQVKTSEDKAIEWLLTDQEDVRTYLYALSPERLAPLMGNAMIRMSVFPHLYKDGQVIPKEGFETKHFQDVPLMLVTGTNEFSLFTAFDPRFMKDFTGGNLFKDEEKAKEFYYVRNYGGNLYRLSNGVESARKMAANYTSDIYVGEISYGDDETVTPELAKGFGAFHGIFEPMLQEPSNYKDFIGENFQTQGAQQMSATFKQYLKQFLATGNPNGETLPKWNKWTAKNNVLSISASKETEDIREIVDEDTAQGILEKMKADQTLSDLVKEELNQTVLNGRWFSEVLDELEGHK
ncbi:carboxylesterase family protein [Streptococcus himalayensis]|uniref:Carboxylic ester hydrolase n=1 Tax=Streptococcus himalayensis TaxID=1888195 RepID=A0A917A7D3_9STRE|nr:carboxylesterase family protein [Streptococcus himalayensis]GGE32175.1 hypothetical protein GCM10011510_11850 [Streptococcus himalayensis]